MDYEHFMGKALDQARKALSAGEFPVGCVIVYQGQILATGSRIGTIGDCPNEIDHAEIIALKHFSEIATKMDKNRASLFTTLEPCLMCMGALILSGIGEIVYAYEDVMGGGTSCDVTKLNPLYKNHPVTIVSNILRQESLELFKAFFNNPENIYWKGSFLARYTLSQ
jgi:tRNA(adenine34) deaminase